MQKRKKKQKLFHFDQELFVRAISQDLLGEEISDLSVFKDTVNALVGGADTHSTDIQTQIRLRQAEAIFKKNASYPGATSNDRRLAALKAFSHGEKKCLLANKRLSFYGRYWTRRPKIWSILEDARESIHELLGPLTPSELHRLFEASSFGNGSTFHARGFRDKTIPSKLAVGSMTIDCRPYFKLARERVFPNWDCLAWSITRGNRIATVPKSAETDRPIAVEPSLNVFLQKGVDVIFKRRLRKWGINLHDQRPNQVSAQLASNSFGLATIDLTSASDTLCHELVKFMLPADWFSYLDDIRSKEYLLDGKWHRYEKFSSMGNATTFPLESMIFAALARATLGGSDLKDLRVYGDDIVMPSKFSLLFFEVLKFCGFSPNPNKSFLFGNFKESCGVDFVSGVDIRPVYVKKWPSTITELFNLHNRLFSHRAGCPMPRTLSYLIGISQKQFFGPPDLGCSLSSDWYNGKAVIVDGYFFSRFKSKLVKLSSNAFGYRIRRYVTEYELFDGFLQRQLYLSFLLGVDERALLNTRKPRLRIVNMELPSWNLPV